MLNKLMHVLGVIILTLTLNICSNHMSRLKMASETEEFDWGQCIFCQNNTGDQLQQPFTGKTSNTGDGYLTVATNIQRFRELECLPMNLNPRLLGNNNEVAALMTDNQARWHKKCSNKLNKLKLNRAEKRKSKESECQISKKMTRHSCGQTTDIKQTACFFCNESSGNLHQASTMNMDLNVRKYALELQDTVLLAKLSAGDLMSQEAVYHRQCYNNVYNMYESKVRDQKQSSCSDSESTATEVQMQGIALAELVAYIEESRAESDNISVFKLSELVKLYHSRLEQLGVQGADRVNATHLKNRILSHFSDLQAHREGRDVLLAFNEDIGTALLAASKKDFDEEAMLLKQAATIVRKEMFNQRCSFDGSFSDSCQQDAVTPSLRTLIDMIIGGPSIKCQTDNTVETQASLSISQLIQFNTVTASSYRRNDQTGPYHPTTREPPLPVYLGLLVHAETRKRTLIDKLYDLGLSVSYDRVLAISTEMGNRVCTRFHAENVVCPPKLRQGVFTTSAVDNIDHNPSSSTAQGSFHGTGISLFQHPSADNEGTTRLFEKEDAAIHNSKALLPLPESYTVVPPVAFSRKEPEIPPSSAEELTTGGRLHDEAIAVEYRWLDHVKDETQADSSEDMETSWSAFHSNPQQNDTPLDTSALLPLFPEQAKSVAMIRHGMDLVTKTVDFLNPGQVPVIACDQPLYAVSKQIQWHFPDSHGEDKQVVMLGGLHIEMAALKALGHWLDGAGWTSAVVQSNLASSGTADSFLKASHMRRTRHIHQVTACALYILLNTAFEDYLSTSDGSSAPMSFENWKSKRSTESPQFQYWCITLDFELTVLIFVRSLREGNFALYKEALAKLAPWFFALDHTNYARWLPVHIRDMLMLHKKHPSISEAFHAGKFVVHKTHHSFSSIPIDQAHEQNNKLVKGDGGAMGLTENPMQLLRWMISGPEETRVISEFEAARELVKKNQSKGPDYRHHEQVKGVQSKFRNQVRALKDVIDEMGNPFMESSEDLLVLDTHDIVSQKVSDTIRDVERVGNEQYQAFVSDRLVTRTKPLSDTIKQNKFPLFGSQPARKLSKDKHQIASLKNNCSLFSQLYISCQVRSGNLDEFFRHENQMCPPSLSNQGMLRQGTKSDLLACFEEGDNIFTSDSPEVDAVLLDCAAVINMLKPGAAKTFEEYFDQIFEPYLRRMLIGVKRLDIVWDMYLPNSLKASTRSQRGIGIRRRVQPDTRIPGNWQSFLRNDQNKTELFRYLGEKSIALECEDGQEVISTIDTLALSNKQVEDLHRISPCQQEEADSRLMLHAVDMAEEGMKKVLMRTVDTDVVVLAVSNCQKMAVDELWLSFGTGKTFRYIPAHTIASTLGPAKSLALPVFHALTGCDQTSAFANKGKKTAWDTWNVYDDVTVDFQALSQVPEEEAISTVMPRIERFVVLMYDKTSVCTTVDEARKELFTRKGRSIEAIPPTSAALLQHVKRAVYQAGHCWGQALVPIPVLPDPSLWGWQKGSDQTWEPVWTTLPQASKSCLEFLKCSCRIDKGCRGRCKCVNANVLCTTLCKCGGGCDRSQ